MSAESESPDRGVAGEEDGLHRDDVVLGAINSGFLNPTVLDCLDRLGLGFSLLKKSFMC